MKELYQVEKDSKASSCGVLPTVASDISYQTKTGSQYTLEIRKVYYNLLVSGMPPDKISSSIKIMLRHFLPNIDVDQVKLPQKSCAQYMRREELKQ